jgi:hypothetical protein
MQLQLSWVYFEIPCVPNLNHDLCLLDALLSKVRLGTRIKISNRACCAMVVLLP